MHVKITDEEWERLCDEDFETISLLRVAEGDELPPHVRTDLFELHGTAMAVINHGERSQVAKMFEQATELEMRIAGMMTQLRQVNQVLERLTNLYPESLSYGGADDEIPSARGR
jgi:hypothetical protein